MVASALELEAETSGVRGQLELQEMLSQSTHKKELCLCFLEANFVISVFLSTRQILLASISADRCYSQKLHVEYLI